ncbi:MAG: glycoside hydrolase family 28 protein [Thermoguttaceae bacterium]
MQRHPTILSASLLVLFLAFVPSLLADESGLIFDVKSYGASGKKTDDAKKAIQAAVDACAKAGGGTVVLPPGEYTSGTIHLRSHVRFYIDGGATLYASTKSADFDKRSLLYAEDAQNITIEGRGTLEGQAAYEWRANKQRYNPDIEVNRVHAQAIADAAGRPLLRPYPTEYRAHMVLLLRCQDVQIAGLSFLHSRSWTIRPYACQRVTIDGIYIYTSPKEAVWADGIDPDGCKDVSISNSTIETGDDAIVFYSTDAFGPALPCENITVTNCRLSSASAALKFCDCNANCVRNVTVDNCVITDSNRGIAFMAEQGGYVDNVVLSNLVINCHRFDWFWWGEGDPIHFEITPLRRHAQDRPRSSDLPGGSIRNVIIRNVIAHGEGSCLIGGHPKSWLNNISLENVKLFLSTNPAAVYDKSVDAMQFQYVKNLTVKDVTVNWEKPEWKRWESALGFKDVNELYVENFTGGPANPQTSIPAAILDNVEDATISGSKAQRGTQVFLGVMGAKSRNIYLVGNELHDAAKAVALGADVKDGTVKAVNNF